MGAKQRATIQGHIVLADPELIRQLRRLPGEVLRHVFQQARDHGSSPLAVNNATYTLHRQSDHTFICKPGATHHYSL